MRYGIRLDRSKYRASERQAADFPTSAVESDDEDVILPPPDLSFAEAHRESSGDGLTRE
jgi:hypothetical protein